MEYTIEQRDGEYHIITDQTYKGDIITINLASVIKTEQAKSLAKSINMDLLWVLRYDENIKKVYMDLFIDLDKGLIFSQELSIQHLIEDCITCLTENKMIEDCSYIMSTINSLYRKAFIEAIKGYGVVICSSIILECNCQAKRQNKVIGEAPRFSINTNDTYSIFEYVGQSLNDESPKLTIRCDDITIDVLTLVNNNNNFYDPDNHYVAYYTFAGLGNIFISKSEQEAKEYVKLKVPMKINTHEAMYNYLIKNNDIDQIIEYKKSMKPKLKLININEYMVNEFNV